MAPSLRTRSAPKTEVEINSTKQTTPKKTVAPKKTAVAKKPVAPKTVTKKATVKKTAEAKKIEKPAVEVKKVEDKKVTPTKKVAPKKAVAKATTVKKVAAPKKTATVKKVETAPKKAVEAKKAAAVKAPAKKATPATKSPTKPVEAVTKKTTVKKLTAPAKKVATPAKKVSVRKSMIVAPIMTIEEVTIPSLPEIMPILKEEPVVMTAEPVAAVVVSTHTRFSDDEDCEPEIKDASVTSSDFEALDQFKDEPTDFELYNSAETELVPTAEDDFDLEEEELVEEVKKESPVVNAHSAFEAFTSQEAPKTFNWNSTGTTYYHKSEDKSDTETESVKPVESVTVPTPTVNYVEPTQTAEAPAPTVISNPFGFGFTATNATISSAPAAVTTARPNPFSSFSASHYQSVSSPLDKLCNLTSQAHPIQVASSFGFNTSNMATSSFLPTSPVAGFSKVQQRSPTDESEDKEARSPSVIQSIIVDDKHEDFSAF